MKNIIRVDTDGFGPIELLQQENGDVTDARFADASPSVWEPLSMWATRGLHVEVEKRDR